MLTHSSLQMVAERINESSLTLQPVGGSMARVGVRDLKQHPEAMCGQPPSFYQEHIL